MASTNTKSKKSHVFSATQLAGGFGPRAAKQDAEMQLRRAVMSCLLWEDLAYETGKSVAENIRNLIPQVDPATVAAIAVEARTAQKLRHVPLFICREMARLPEHKAFVADTLANVIRRPDEIAEFLAIYWGDSGYKGNNGKKTLSAQVKRGLAAAFAKFDEYQLQKYSRDGKQVGLRDALFLCHAKGGQDRSDLYKRLVEGKLAVADTWEVGLSAAKTPDEKRDVWVRLLTEGKLGALAFLKNLRNMQEVCVPKKVIAQGFEAIRPTMLLPIDFLRAATHAPDWRREIENLMFRCTAEFPKLQGFTTFVVDVSGSMTTWLSGKTEHSRLDAAASMAMLAMEMCEHVDVWVTAGCDGRRIHQTEKLPTVRGFALSDAITASTVRMGGGGIFTRQCLGYLKTQYKGETPDRIIVFSDSQDCDYEGTKKPQPFGKFNYIVDVSPHKHGINYEGVWTAEIAGWSENFLRYVAAYESSSQNVLT